MISLYHASVVEAGDGAACPQSARRSDLPDRKGMRDRDALHTIAGAVVLKASPHTAVPVLVGPSCNCDDGDTPGHGISNAFSRPKEW